MKVENFKRFSLKMLCCEAWAFPVGTATWRVGHFLLRGKRRMRMNLDHVDSGHFVLTWERHRERPSLQARLLVIGSKTVSMPPTMLCPQCKGAIPVRRKTCECYDQVFRSRRKAECINLREKAMKNQLGKLKISCKRPVKECQKLVSELCIGRNKTECAWQAWESHETVIDFLVNTQVQSHALLRWGFGTSVPFIGTCRVFLVVYSI